MSSEGIRRIALIGIVWPRKLIVAIVLTFASVTLSASLSSAEPITIHYIVTITERANVVHNTTMSGDPRVGLFLGPWQPYHATFSLRMTFEPLLGHGTVGGSLGLTQRTTYGTPTFSTIRLPRAHPLVSIGDPGTSVNQDGQTFEQQKWLAASGSSSLNWGAYFNDVVQRVGDVETGSTTLLSHLRPASLTGPNDPAFHSVPLATYLSHMRGVLEFDFVTWSIFNLSSPGEAFTSDSYDYRGIARAVPPHAVPEPSTLMLLGVGLLAAGATTRRRAKCARPKLPSASQST